MKRIARISVAAAILVAVVFGMSLFSDGGNGAAALAQAVEHLNQARTVTWTDEIYQNLSTKDRKTTWLRKTISKHMFKAPGLLRREDYDEQGRIEMIRVEDHSKGIYLYMWPRKKTATLTYRGEPLESERGGANNLVSHVKQWLTKKDGRWIMSEPQPLGDREIDGRRTIGYRVSRDQGDIGLPGREHWSADLWIDAETGNLVRVNNPGLDVYDVDKDPARDTPPGKKYSTRSMGYEMRDIAYDQVLDDSLFSFDVPEGYEVTTTRIPEPTEKDLVEWLGIYAQCNGGTFTDDGSAPWGEPMREILKKANTKQKLTPAEEKWLNQSCSVDRRRPVRRFAEKIAGKSWHYAGKGVRLGDKEQIVCWYQPKGSKTYRVVYGDLSIKSVSPEDLPAKSDPQPAQTEPQP